MRDRAADLLAEEDDLAKALASTWARDPDKEFPRLHAEPDRLLARASAQFWTIDSTPESPDTPVVAGIGLGPGRRRRRRASPTGSPSCSPTVHRVVVAADGDGLGRSGCASSCSTMASTSRSHAPTPT